MDEKVTIIIPAYNVEPYIKRCIQSCCDQTYKKIEIIAVDDGSTDETWSAIQEMAQIDGRIISITQANKGVSEARNTALNAASGESVLFLDSDDWLEKNAVEHLLSYKKNEDTLICCDCYFVYENEAGQDRVCQNHDYLEGKCAQKELIGNIGITSRYRLGSACYKLFSRKIIEENKLRFTPGIHQGEDGLFTFQYICHIHEAVYTREPLWNIYDRPGSACNSPYNFKWKTAIEAVNKMIDYGKEMPDWAQSLLRAYKAERAMWLETSCVRSPAYNKEDFIYFRSILRQNGKYLIKREKKIKTVLQYVLYALIPPLFTRMIIKGIKASK